MRLAATSVDPEPQKGSRTRPHGSQKTAISGSSASMGFWVGWSRLPATPASVQAILVMDNVDQA
ncbi:MAG: hypothetical protein WB660_02695 [Candidatus Sulfotelmatobacter sp.]